MSISIEKAVPKMRTVLCLGLAMLATLAIPQTIRWAKSYEAAITEARRSNKLAMVFFHADWCTYSQKMKATTLKSAAVAKSLEAVVPVSMNIETDGKQLKEKFELRMFPSFVFIEPSGKVFGQMGGYMGATLFQDEITKFSTAYREMPKLLEAYKRKPADGEINARLAWLYGIRRNEELALKHLNAARQARYRGPYMAKAFNMVGDVFQLSGKYDTAIEYFELGLESAITREDTSYSLVSLFTCSLSKRNYEAANRYGRMLLKQDGANPAYVAIVREDFQRRGIKL